jgi:surface carbohydrate biosynthesis protein (TIGR04326 family)
MVIFHMTYDGDTLCVWDSQVAPEYSANTRIYQWNGYIENDVIHSIPLYIESNSNHLRQRYLSFVHDLGKSKINNKSLIEHLALEGDFSYWWMTLFVEKSVYKSPITEVMRMLALEEIINKNKPNKIQLVSGNKILNKTLSEFCKNLEISYEWKKISNEKLLSFNFNSFRTLIPPGVFTFISLIRYVFFRWPLRREETAWPKRENSVFFCSQFSNINPSSFSSGKFTSDLWGGLPNLLNSKNTHLNWLHFLVSPSSGPRAKEAASFLEIFNKNGKESEVHSFLEANISIRLVLRVMKRWIGLYLISWKLRGVENQFYPRLSKLSLWPLLKKDWKSSIYGQVAINNLLWFELFDTFMSKVQTQSVGFYLCENQAWERSFIHLWRKYGHGQLIAVTHSTVRFWDLRHYSDIRTLTQAGAYKMPKADLIALNGNAAIDMYISAGFPEELIVGTEALRFEYLYKIKLKNSIQVEKESTIRILILGDYMKSATIEMLQLLEKATQYISINTTFTIKSHPNFVVKKEDFPLLRLEVTMDPLEEILHKYDISFSSNMTSAAVDAFCFGLPSIVILDSMGLNFSPLRGQSNVNFVGTPEKLAELIQSVNNGVYNTSSSNDFFFLNPSLPRWQKLLDLSIKNL